MSQSRAWRRPRFSRRMLLDIGLGVGAAGAFNLLAPHRVPAAVLGASPARAPRRGGTLLAAQEVDPISLDPHTNANISALQGYEHMYESLTAYDEKMNVVPALATRCERDRFTMRVSARRAPHSWGTGPM